MESLELGQGQMKAAEDAARAAAAAGCVSDREADLLFQLAQVQLFAWTLEVLLADAASYLKLSKQMARRHLGEIEEKGLIEAVSKRPLKFQLSREGRALVGLRGR